MGGLPTRCDVAQNPPFGGYHMQFTELTLTSGLLDFSCGVWQSLFIVDARKSHDLVLQMQTSKGKNS